MWRECEFVNWIFILQILDELVEYSWPVAMLSIELLILLTFFVSCYLLLVVSVHLSSKLQVNNIKLFQFNRLLIGFQNIYLMIFPNIWWALLKYNTWSVVDRATCRAGFKIRLNCPIKKWLKLTVTNKPTLLHCFICHFIYISIYPLKPYQYH